MMLDELADLLYRVGVNHRTIGPFAGLPEGVKALKRRQASAIVLALADDIEAAVDYMGSEPNHWANANHRLRALIAEARTEATR